MAEQAPKKARKAQGPRKAKPIFLVIRYTDENGQPFQLEQSRISVEAVKDPAQLVTMLTKPGGAEGAAVVTVQPETPRPNTAA